MQNTPIPGSNPNASQEAMLLDYLVRLEKHRHDRRCVHIHISSLQPNNARDHHMRIAVGTFDNMVRMLNAQMFMIANKDMIIIYRAQIQADMEAAIVKLRYLFAEDPLLLDEESAEGFCEWFSLDREFDQVMDMAHEFLRAEEARQKAVRDREARANLAPPPKGKPFTPELLARTEAALFQADLANLIRRQAICAMIGDSPPQAIFQEIFISISDLRATLMPSVNMASSPWLFQQLTETLDRRVLALLNRHDDNTLEGDISINLNVATILTPEFLTFDDNVKASKRGTIVLELQKVDIFADLSCYLFARDFAHERGYRICIDGLTYPMLPYVDRERLGADLIKLVWDNNLSMETRGKPDALRRAGISRIIMCRCDTEASIDFGKSLGISLYQGRFVDGALNDVRRRGVARKRR